ncbi:UPF0179 family protein [Methanohalophilus halophilus]|uniref:UPF0179 protein BHR79_06635 n=1 Tax=Methanohalophilus halophilus TaxID=2177 RepID=A0A1L3Q2Y1_9EURY|nr:UPF0179 family protein [Methanohalophilus halophilus]APH39193.1 hypothetical protein BHR79_06635 [Methanohalophilus halophilus]RNI09749.1 UPF0179 family protein [Methanohalophilus halophilus]SDW55565.1 hypothetical protein SAMN04515625_1183 [Methanohalophilus halophilus]
MDEEDTMITLIGTQLAREGEEFIFEGEAPECEKCKLRNTCMNLEKGRKYVVRKIRTNTLHECFVHEQGAYVVDVAKAPIVAAIDSRNAVQGSTISYKEPKCDTDDQELYDLFHPAGIKNGDKCTVAEVMGNIESDKCSGHKKVKLKF